MNSEFYGGITIYPSYYDGSALGFGPTFNTLVLYPFQVYQTTLVDRVSFHLTAAPGGLAAISFGLFDFTKTRVLAAKQTTIATGAQTISISPVTISPKAYWLGVTEAGATGTYRVHSLIVAATQAFQNSTGIKYGTGGATTSGDLPASFTTLTASSALNVPVVRFWNSAL